jgi:hypothetical protein
VRGEHAKESKPSVARKPYQLLSVAVLREYLALDLRPVGQGGRQVELSFPLDIERLFDDFIFMCFFVGEAADCLIMVPRYALIVHTLCVLPAGLATRLQGLVRPQSPYLTPQRWPGIVHENVNVVVVESPAHDMVI